MQLQHLQKYNPETGMYLNAIVDENDILKSKAVIKFLKKNMCTDKVEIRVNLNEKNLSLRLPNGYEIKD